MEDYVGGIPILFHFFNEAGIVWLCGCKGLNPAYICIYIYARHMMYFWATYMDIFISRLGLFSELQICNYQLNMSNYMSVIGNAKLVTESPGYWTLKNIIKSDHLYCFPYNCLQFCLYFHLTVFYFVYRASKRILFSHHKSSCPRL